jgi:hypothetical protein
MTRVAICGSSLVAAAAVLGLEPVDERPDLVLVDLSDPAGLRLAAAIPAAVPRVVVASAEHDELLRAVACSTAVARSADAAVLGPLVASAIPPPARRSTRLVVVTSSGGGSGRSLLVANLAARLAPRSVLVLDATGSGAVGWWLRLSAAPWSDLEGLVDELAEEHLAIVAAERDAIRLVGGAPSLPTKPLLAAAARAAVGLAEIVIVDAPPLADERTVALREQADRVLVLIREDTASHVGLDALEPGDWVLASGWRAARVAGRDVLRSLPDDAGAIRAAARGPDPVGGVLGRAYDEVAELLAIDASP